MIVTNTVDWSLGYQNEKKENPIQFGWGYVCEIQIEFIDSTLARLTDRLMDGCRNIGVYLTNIVHGVTLNKEFWVDLFILEIIEIFGNVLVFDRWISFNST